jgi:hypothetical protein
MRFLRYAQLTISESTISCMTQVTGIIRLFTLADTSTSAYHVLALIRLTRPKANWRAVQWP